MRIWSRRVLWLLGILWGLALYELDAYERWVARHVMDNSCTHLWRWVFFIII